MPDIKKLILEKSSELKEEAIRLRRNFHKYPELSYQETETSAFICDWLEQNNIEYKNRIAGTGIIAKITGQARGCKVIAVRAEMDALPITDEQRHAIFEGNARRVFPRLDAKLRERGL